MTQQPQNTLKDRTKKSNKQLFIWTFGWVVSLAVVAFGPQFIWDYNLVITGVTIAANVLFGYRMVMANKQLLENLDELHRQVHMNAMAITLGVSLVFIPLYGLLESINVLNISPNPSAILFLMSFTYMASMVLGFRKYK